MKKTVSVLTAGAVFMLALTGLCGCTIGVPQEGKGEAPPVVVTRIAASEGENEADDQKVIPFTLPVLREGTVEPSHEEETYLVLSEQDPGSFTAEAGGKTLDMNSISLAEDGSLSAGSGELRRENGTAVLYLPADTYIVIPGYRYMALQELIRYNEGRETFTPLPGAYVGIEEETQ